MVALVLITVLVGVGAVGYRDFNARQTNQAASLAVINALRDVQTKAQSNLKPEFCTSNSYLLYGWQANYSNAASVCPNGPCVYTEGYCSNPTPGSGPLATGAVVRYSLPQNSQFWHTTNGGNGDANSEVYFRPLGIGVCKNPLQASQANLDRYIVVRTGTGANTYWSAVCVSRGGEIRSCGTPVKQTTPPGAGTCSCVTQNDAANVCPS